MHVIALGQPYAPDMTSLPNGPMYDVREGIHELSLFRPNVTPIEAEIVRSARLDFALRIEGPVIFVLFRFGAEDWQDTPFTIHLEHPEEREVPTDIGRPDDHTPVYITLADSTNAIVRGLRVSTLSPEFTRVFKEAIVKQSAMPFVREEYENFITAFYQQHPTSESMLDRVDARCQAGD